MGYIEHFFGIKADDLNLDDIYKFIERKFEESSILEYTGADTLKNRKELCKEVSAFANSGGGLLIIGINEDKKGGKIYPHDITFSDGSVTKEDLDQIFNDNIEPPIRELKIVPKRKNKETSEVIFLIDIPKSKDILHFVRPSNFYKRLNFGKKPMTRDEIYVVFKERLSYEKCALYRFWLSYYLHDFMISVIVYLSDQELVLEKADEIFDKFTKKTPEEIVELMKRPEFNVGKLDLALYSLKRDFITIKHYPHNEITPEESILLQAFEEWLPSTEREISDWLSSEAKFIGMGDKLDTLIEESKKIDEHFLHVLKSHAKGILEISKLVLKLKIMYNKMEKRYGPFHDYVSRITG